MIMAKPSMEFWKMTYISFDLGVIVNFIFGGIHICFIQLV